jgi:flagellar motor protein MotB
MLTRPAKILLTALLAAALPLSAAEKKKDRNAPLAAKAQKALAAEKAAADGKTPAPAPTPTDVKTPEAPAAPAAAQQPATQAPAETKPQPAAQAPATPDNLDVTIKGQAKDDIQIEKVSPPTDIPLQDLVTLSREGETEKVLAMPLDYVSPHDRQSFMDLNSLQVVTPLPLHFAKPPFCRMETPRNAVPYLWEFSVVDQDNHTLKVSGGKSAFPQKMLEWDGKDDAGRLAFMVGKAYNPVLTTTDVNGNQQKFYGDPVQIDVIEYEQGDLLNVEFNNDRLYERGQAVFAPDMAAVLEGMLNLLRARHGTPIRLIVYDTATRQSLAGQRIEIWKKYLQEQLLIPADDITTLASPVKDRGIVTTISMQRKIK